MHAASWCRCDRGGGGVCALQPETRQCRGCEGVRLFYFLRALISWLRLADVPDGWGQIFVDSDSDVRLARRVVRDLEERSLPLDAIFDQHLRHSKSSYELVILPTKQTADIILPGASIAGGVELIAQGVMDDVRSGRMRRGAGATEVVVHAGLDILSEADLVGGGVGYYETV